MLDALEYLKDMHGLHHGFLTPICILFTFYDDLRISSFGKNIEQ